MSEMGRELSWDSEIQQDSTFELVPEGEYNFEVRRYERGRHEGSAKLPACPKAMVEIRVDNGTNATTITHNLFLHTTTEPMLSSFFAAIGMKKKGEAMRINFPDAIGRKGRCKVGVRKWEGRDGEERTSNEISRFIMPEGYDAPAPTAPHGFQAGTF